jgi:hypothetical protein
VLSQRPDFFHFLKKSLLFFVSDNWHENHSLNKLRTKQKDSNAKKSIGIHFVQKKNPHGNTEKAV